MVAAAAPNRRIIGGAGTWVPPVDDEVPPEELELLLVLDADELAEDVEPLLPLEPKLDEPPVAPELVELEPLLADDADEAEDEALLPDEAELPLLPELPEEPELPDDPEEPLLPELPLEL